jgi:hypothetical protein
MNDLASRAVSFGIVLVFGCGFLDCFVHNHLFQSWIHFAAAAIGPGVWSCRSTTPRRLRRRRRHDDFVRTRDDLFASVRLLADLALMQPVHSFHKTIAKYGYY